ncbi:MAG: AAA family ATPase, partial [Candidatus Eisenbacteria bacterium]|nr:AAA family ATPase [Candidatus Eisenbacteria bacterium]
MERALFVAMSSADGVRDHVPTTRSVLRELGTLPEEMCRRLALQAAEQLARVHSDGDVLGEGFDLDSMLLLGDGSLQLFRSGRPVGMVAAASNAAPNATDLAAADLVAADLAASDLASLQQADVRRLAQLLLEAGTRGGSRAAFSPFFDALLTDIIAGGAPEAAPSPCRPVLSAEQLAQILREGERSEWWRERAVETPQASVSSPHRSHAARETALHGRDRDLQRLRAAYERAKAGEGNVVLLEGEAGIGKTRLVDELVSVLERDGEAFHFLFGSYPPGGAATDAGAFLAAYREHLGDCGRERRLERAVERALASSSPSLAAPFAALLRGGAASESDRLTKESIQTGFVLVTRALASERPAIVCIDDLHFAPDDGRALFAALALGVPGHRILLIGSARPELPDSWTAAILRPEHATRLSLERLRDPDFTAIVADALGSAPLAGDLGPILMARCDGNPLFLLEHLHALEEARLLARGADGVWTGTLREHQIPRPDSVRQLIRSRLEGLDEEDRHLLEFASCDGFEFDPLLVAEASGAPVLDTLRRFGLIEKRHGLIRAAGRRYAFDHHQVQETLQESLFEPLREHYHAALAIALEAREAHEHARDRDPREMDGEIAVSLAEHFAKGGRGEESSRYL